MKPTYAAPIWLGKYRIFYDPICVPLGGLDWVYAHDDLDIDDDRCGRAANPTECIAAIIEREGEHYARHLELVTDDAR